MGVPNLARRRHASKLRIADLHVGCEPLKVVFFFFFFFLVLVLVFELESW